MPHADPAALDLRPHRDTPSAAVRAIAVRARPAAGGLLQLEYVMEGDLARVRLAAQGPGGRADGLWRHTCFEVFVATAGSTEYLELNFAPCGQWAAYRFSDYREARSVLELSAPPQIRTHRAAGRLALAATVQSPALMRRAADRAALRLGLTAVVEEESGALSYWALSHPGARPDFHDRRAFSLELEVP
jgi:hypothetical protein